jgi:glycosyltransferase involved in cell wall biosynthesis
MSDKTKITIAHLGARKHYQEPILLHEWGILDTFYTDFYARNNLVNRTLRNFWIYSKLSSSLKKMLGRYTPKLNGAKVVDFPILGIQYHNKLRDNRLEDVYDIHISTGQEFNRKIIAKGLENSNVVYGFNGASLELFEFAKSKGIKCILDQTIAERSLESKLLLEEERKWQDWSKTSFCDSESTEKLLQREKKEQSLADHIICGSDFVKTSLISSGVLPHKITVIPLGKTSDFLLSNNVVVSEKKHNQTPLNILFVGSVGLRKGIPYLLESLKIIQNKIPYHCKVVGGIELKNDKIQAYEKNCDFLGRLPRSEMDNLYQWADVFVLPSICEGSAMVVYEALLYGLPVITTHNSGSIVRDGIDGFIVPICDPSAIADSLIKISEDRSSWTNEKRLEQRQLYLESVNEKAQQNLRSLLTS